MYENSKRCLIISGGEFAKMEESASRFDYVIACDKGYLNAFSLDITPNIIIGDFDSYLEEITEIPVIKLPVMKDDTDTLSAVKYAMDEGYNDITVCCAFGGRFDHSFANIQTAAYIASRGGRAAMFGVDSYVYAFSNGSITLPRRPGHTLSVFSLTDKCEEVYATGVLYPLENAVITNCFPIGVSNTWAEETASISTGDGILLVVVSKDN